MSTDVLARVVGYGMHDPRWLVANSRRPLDVCVPSRVRPRRQFAMWSAVSPSGTDVGGLGQRAGSRLPVPRYPNRLGCRHHCRGAGDMLRSALCTVGSTRPRRCRCLPLRPVAVSHRLFTGYDRKKTRIVETQHVRAPANPAVSQPLTEDRDNDWETFKPNP
jgi:hypothetical protein